MITTLERVKTVLQITDSSKDDLIVVLIPIVESDYIRIRNRPFSEVDGAVVYPEGSELTAIKMVGYLLETNGSAGSVTSKSVGPLSVSYAQVKDGYPEGVISSIKRYVRVG